MIRDPNDFISTAKEVYWLMNINDEQNWLDRKILPLVTDPTQNSIVSQQEQQLLFLARPEHHVVLNHKPPDDFISYLRGKIGNLPQMVHVNDLPPLNHALLIPYINSEEVLTWKAVHNRLEVFGSDVEISRKMNNKYVVRKMVEDAGLPVTLGHFCKSVDELVDVYDSLKRKYARCVIKLPYGSSGKGLFLIKSDADFRRYVKYLEKRKSEFELLIEGWHPIKHSLNCQVYIDPNQITILGISHQRITNEGVYLGTSFTPELHESATSKYIDKVTDISKMLQDMGYRGIAGFDSIIDENDQLIPAVEINARFTQVTYLLPWVKLLQDQFPYIESRYVKLFSEREHSFTEIAEKCDQVIHGEYTIYTFAKERNERGYVYKVFSMFYSNTLDQLNRMIDQFSGIAL